MSPAFDRVDVIGKGKDALGVAVVPLHSDLDFDGVFFSLEVNYLGMDCRLGTIEVLDKRGQAAFVKKLVFFLAPFVFDGDFDAAI